MALQRVITTTDDTQHPHEAPMAPGAIDDGIGRTTPQVLLVQGAGGLQIRTNLPPQIALQLVLAAAEELRAQALEKRFGVERRVQPASALDLPPNVR